MFGFGRREPEIYVRRSRQERLEPQHLVRLLALLAVLYVVGSALMTWLGVR
ncbi:MAG TPA: hypothetical protein VNM66_08380 [Thermodesulfobacteriota bacterium]|nr:hypothetical protein [Thermodesulfobacteriota bacterium]